tara:strand:+ start:72 stop:671 length:600 start_codon:yes stop_codon:yes gene_type:complete
MTSVNEINIGDKTNMHYYDPKENTNVSLIPKQLYPMHCKKVTTREVDVKGKHKAIVYNIIYEIAEECSQKKYPTENGEISGSAFVGKEIWANGIFMFLNPKPGDSFEANNGANERYLNFCETIRVECPDIEVDVDGEKRMVKQFPKLEESDIIGKPVMGFIDIQKYVKDGETRTSYKVKDFMAWTDGKVKDFAVADLPF